MADVIEIDALTGVVTERAFTKEEQLHRNAEADAAAKAEADAIAKAKADALARDAAIAHAKTLGFTEEMIAVMYPNLSATAV